MSEKQAEKYLDNLSPEVYLKYAKAWEQSMWRLPTSLSSFANWIINQQ